MDTEKTVEEMITELRAEYGELACRLAAAYISWSMGNALQTQYKKIDKKTIGAAWLCIAKQLMILGPSETAERLVDPLQQTQKLQ
jgi:hypothetical protein